MQIIFGDAVELVKDRFTVLELDTFLIESSGHRVKTWCVVEEPNLEEIPILDNLVKMHQDLIEQYRKQNWDFCQQALEKLQGRFNGELDTFYSHLAQRVENFRTNPPDADWTGDLVKDLPVKLVQVDGAADF